MHQAKVSIKLKKMSSVKILLYDENWAHLEELTMILQMEGLHVFPVTTPEQAFAQAQKITPQIIITEIRRPVLAQITLLKQLRAKVKSNNIPIMCYTSDQSITKDSLEELDINLLVYQPFSAEVLLKAIHNLIKQN